MYDVTSAHIRESTVYKYLFSSMTDNIAYNWGVNFWFWRRQITRPDRPDTCQRQRRQASSGEFHYPSIQTNDVDCPSWQLPMSFIARNESLTVPGLCGVADYYSTVIMRGARRLGSAVDCWLWTDIVSDRRLRCCCSCLEFGRYGGSVLDGVSYRQRDSDDCFATCS